MSPDELLDDAEKNDVKSLAITDINTTSACLAMAQLAQKRNLKIIPGVDFRNGAKQLFVAIAQNNEGFFEINRFLSHHLQHNTSFADEAPKFDHAFVIYPYSQVQNRVLGHNEFVGVTSRELTQMKLSGQTVNTRQMVILHPVTFRHKRDFNIHRLLRAIDNNTLLSKLPKHEEGSELHVMKPSHELKLIYADYPEIIQNTFRLLESCEVNFTFGSEHPPKNKKSYSSSEEEDWMLIQQLCREGLSYRYPNANSQVWERVEKELEMIRQKNFLSYFLINWDIVSYARRKGYFYVGRGSGANSVVAYLLRITDVDPIELDLYFERFINLFRKSPPDFDIDFSWTDRDDVIQYIFNRFPNVSLLATYNTFQHKAIIHELGKVFGLPKGEIELLQEGKFQHESLDQLSVLVLKYSRLIQGFPNHLGIHAGGILISEKPIHYYTATSWPPKGFPITQFDMIVAEDVGLYKFDILSQRGLGKIKDAIDIVRTNQPNASMIDIHRLDLIKNDEKVKHLLRNAMAIGCFYVESPAMRMLLKKLEVDDYLGLVAASSIIRPGVAQSGMMREYILRKKNPERRKDAHPVLLDMMPDTFGVMVYQEDVIKVAHYFAGLSLAEADVLRRAMSGKFRSREEFAAIRDKFVDNCRIKGYAEQLINDIWRQIESFAGYAFAKGHSASYAVESFQSLYLKAYFPLEFMVAVINNYGGFYHTEFYVNEARLWGAIIQPPCVNTSQLYATIYGINIYMGLLQISGFEANIANLILAERTKNGVFVSFTDFMDRVPITLEQITLLIRIDAFRFTGVKKRELLWNAHFILSKKTSMDHQPQLFYKKKKSFQMPELSGSVYEDAFDQIELLGFPLMNFFELLQSTNDNPLRAQHLPSLLGKMVTIWGYLVTAKYVRTSNRKIMNFGTFIDRDGRFVDTTHFPEVAKKFPFRGRGIYAITGKVVEEFGFCSIEVTQMHKLPLIEDPRYSEKPLPLQQTG
jgi:DNA polymerase-3 subunit alpha